MTKHVRSMTCALAVVLLLSCMLAQTAHASVSKGRCYTISAGSTSVYTSSSLKKKVGTISGSCEIRILSVSRKSCKVSYTGSDGRTKKGYISTGAILRGTNGHSCKLRKKITIYRRPGGRSLGNVACKSSVQTLGTSGKYTQIRCTRSGSTWFAFVKTEDLNAAR